jgi:chaperone modulatory protein CbpM
MAGTSFVRLVDCELEEPLTIEMVAEAVGARPAQLARLIRLGVLDPIDTGGGAEQVLLSTRSVMRLRRMHRLRRDLGVNFVGAGIILDLVERIDHLSRELAELRRQL